MLARAFWKTVTLDRSDLLDRFLARLEHHKVRYCLVGGQAVNAYVDPVVSLDVDIVIAADDWADLEATLRREFDVERFPHSLNISSAGSDLRIQIQTDVRYVRFVDGAQRRDVLGLQLPVAAVDDVLQGKIWAVQDPSRRASKRQKDLADIARLLESHPDLRQHVPSDVLQRLL